jgi:hypothetical protein
MLVKELQGLLKTDPNRWPAALSAAVGQAASFEELIALATLKKRADALGVTRPREKLRLAILGAYSLYRESRPLCGWRGLRALHRRIRQLHRRDPR